jgi:hypothetical protein
MASHHSNAPITSERKGMVPPKCKMRLTCQWQMGKAEECRRLFED